MRDFSLQEDAAKCATFQIGLTMTIALFKASYDIIVFQCSVCDVCEPAVYKEVHKFLCHPMSWVS